MSDPYNRGAFGDPQSLAILDKLDRRKASSFHSLQIERDKVESGCVDALRQWGQKPSLPIHLAIEGYFKNKDTPEQLRRAEGSQHSFEIAQVFAGMWMTFGPTLCLNRLSGEVEWEGGALCEKQCGLLHQNKQWSFGRLPTYDEVVAYAEHNSYSPVERYLLGLHATETNHLQTLYEVGRVALGVEDELCLMMVAKTVIGAVARALSPGCEQQTCLVLQGPQGVGKTTFFKTLFGKEFFGHLDTNRDQREWVMAMASRWCVELGELEAFTSKKSAGMLKNFLSSSEDTYRRPYERTPQTAKRHSVCVGSVNVECPLVDETGNRRYWMVPVRNRIDVEWVEANRDRIWASARALYAEGEPWWFDYEMEQLVMSRSESFRQTDPWEELLGEFLNALECGADVSVDSSQEVREMLFSWNAEGGITTSALLNALGVSKDRQTRSFSNRLSAVMRALLWEQKTVRANGRKQREWRPLR
jgi:predicted P-loop ATPase